MMSLVLTNYVLVCLPWAPWVGSGMICIISKIFSTFLPDGKKLQVGSGMICIISKIFFLLFYPTERSFRQLLHYITCGWSGGAMVLGKLPVPGRPTIWITVGQGPTALAVGAGGGRLDIFTLIYPFSPLSPALWVTA